MHVHKYNCIWVFLCLLLSRHFEFAFFWNWNPIPIFSADRWQCYRSLHIVRPFNRRIDSSTQFHMHKDTQCMYRFVCMCMFSCVSVTALEWKFFDFSQSSKMTLRLEFNLLIRSICAIRTILLIQLHTHMYIAHVADGGQVFRSCKCSMKENQKKKCKNIQKRIAANAPYGKINFVTPDYKFVK